MMNILTNWTLCMALLSELFLAGCSDLEDRLETPLPETAAPLTATAYLEPLTDQEISGQVTFKVEENHVNVSGTILGLEEGKHGFHVHEGTTCEDYGGHFAPESAEHGSPNEMEHHVGDLGNLVTDSTGTAVFSTLDRSMTLEGDHSVVGHALIVHQGEDGFLPQPSGDSGEVIACGIIELQ
jgi:Cu-Zn family superoxide dismutase